MNQDEVEMHRRRQAAYLALAKAFLQQPDEGFFDGAAVAVVYDHAGSEQADRDVDRGTSYLKEWQRRMVKARTEALALLQLDYVRLFVGPNEVLAPTWESVYRTSDHLVFGESTLAVRNMYRKYGLATPNINREPDDHFGLELAFMSVLAERTADGSTEDTADALIQDQWNFLQEHLGVWTRDFTGRILESAHTEYYLGLALIACGFIQQDTRWFATADAITRAQL